MPGDEPWIEGVGRVVADLAAPVGPLLVGEHGPVAEGHEVELDAGVAEEVEFRRRRSQRVDTDDRAGPQTEAGGHQGAIGDATSETPPARVVLGEISRRRTDHHDSRRADPTAAHRCSDGVARRSRQEPGV